MIRSSKLTGALIDGRLFDQSIVGVFPKDDTWTLYLLGFINSNICSELINAINPSTNNSANYIKKIPFIKPDTKTRAKVELLVKDIISSIENTIKKQKYIKKAERQKIIFVAPHYCEKKSVSSSRQSAHVPVGTTTPFPLRRHPH